MGSKPGIAKINWKTPEGRLARALLHELKIKAPQLGQRQLAEAFFRLWPGCQKYFEHPITPNKLWLRWDTGRRPDTPNHKYSCEHPDKNVETKKYLPYAREIIANDVPISDGDVQQIATKVKNQVAEPKVELGTEAVGFVSPETGNQVEQLRGTPSVVGTFAMVKKLFGALK
jgi:hypothetical protein